MRANGAFAADSTFLCLLFAVFTATAQVVRNHMREKEGLNWSCELQVDTPILSSLSRAHLRSCGYSVQTIGLEVYEQTLYLLWHHTG